MSSLLEQINGPADLKKLTVPELETLAEEIRQFMLRSISKTGGHLASNLGAVEMTLALHYVFDFKQDKLLWDVGHQCYTHKIITGRKAGFERLRQVEGISGFPNPSESEYDQFTVGHAGTSVTTAVGMALGEQLKAKVAQSNNGRVRRKPRKAEPAAPKIVAFVGDASIVNGTSFEGLNNLGLVKRQLLIVLNDNSMAIDATVGAVAKYFSRFRLSHTYEDMRRTARNILEHVPGIGRGVDEAVEKIKKTIRMVLPPSQLFESLNVPYFGPVDGHDIESLVRLFEALKEVNHPVLLHVYSKKGKGFDPADEGPTRFHSTGPFKINGDCVESAPESTHQSFTEAFGAALAELAERDDRIVAITSAMCDGTGLVTFREKHPERFYDVGIAESAAVDIAAGIAKTGLRPVVCIYSTFLQRAFDQVFQEVALQNLPVVFCVDRAGLVGSDGPTHHGLMDIGYMRMMPNMVLVAPADAVEMKHALEFALAQSHPVVIRYPKDAVPSDEFVRAASDKPFELGQSILVKRGRRPALTVACYGTLLPEALRAAQTLHGEGIAIDVVNARFAAPVDDKILTGLTKGKGLITVEDHHVACGFGSAVLERASELGLDAGCIRVLAAPRRFIGHDSRRSQLMQVGVTADDIVNAAKEMLNDRGAKRAQT
ncbi:MAG: 1-deoxy-D-xylulose-5-phosphate synthase [Sedimentisphaerales bacterium]|jgi:1-deoxy-D-xylulose-5-phosphate synthase|nr:1-deoxy-D-xylulose-5-phosphate synthase [Sedimentisphaerales bacterium]HNY77552.1 1-deoxy-D-xylulose-5-phosphate synthase [Sedimentisphaerales bacterium]HOC61885.1 1-deoxy-D-xylulose-5-phosphate synthase [Sedimentisphaerales bacterium]HOH63727.1 1-deoxy-D-xylulose-5-phosphate synthase [Sedimentisphaerales bacterium]HQA88176.1 1-deoxy-D-xylulose-5-phosphate synthase [Sedimentisphaerales bacterium]